MYLSLLLLTGAIILVALWWFIEYKRILGGLRDIPTMPYCVPILGHAIYFRRGEHFIWTWHKLIMKYGNGRLLRMAIGFIFTWSICEPKYLETVLTDSRFLDKSRFYAFFHQTLGASLITIDGSQYRMKRKYLWPGYRLDRALEVFNRNAAICIRKLRPEADGHVERTDIMTYLTALAMDNFCETALGITLRAYENNGVHEFVQGINALTDIVMERIRNIFKHPNCLYRLTADYQRELMSLKHVHGFTQAIIRERREELLNGVAVDDSKRLSILDSLLQCRVDGVPLTDEEIIHEVTMFLIAGEGTTTVTMSFAIHEIAKQPLVQAQLIAEQRRIFNDDPHRGTTADDVREMRYLEMVIKETLRKFPTVPTIARTATADLHIGEHYVRKGTDISISIWTLHRNPEIYPEPERFDPERFTPENCAQRHPFAYLPFSIGTRNCPGQKFAMLEMKATLGAILRCYEFSEAPDSDLQVQLNFIMTSANGASVIVRPRIW